MRQECKHFESRTYANGDTVRKCNLDLAPDAPWRCPADCPKYEPSADVPKHLGLQTGFGCRKSLRATARQ